MTVNEINQIIKNSNNISELNQLLSALVNELEKRD